MTDNRSSNGSNGDRDERYSRATRRTGNILACIAEQPVGFAVPLFALIVFLSAPQMPDMFAGMKLGTFEAQPWVAYAHPFGLGLGAAFLGFMAWYWTRAALMATEEMDDLERRAMRKAQGRAGLREPSDWAREWAPRLTLLLTALIAGSPLIMSAVSAERMVHDAPIFSSVVGIVLVFVVLLITRYRLAIGLAGGLRASPLMWKTRITAILAAAPFGWLFALALMVVSAFGAWLVAFHPEIVETFFDTPSSGLLALGLIIGPLVFALALLRDLIEIVLFIITLPLRTFARLTYLDEFADIAGVILLIAILYTPTLLAQARWEPPQLYRVRTADTVLSEGERRCPPGVVPASISTDEEAPPTISVSRPDIKEALVRWRAARLAAGYPADRPMPVIIVAAEGGASRAAVWLLATMRMLDEKTNGEFGRQIFAFSGVSGGSLGAITYLQAVRAYGSPAGGLDWKHPAVEQGLNKLAEADLLDASIATYFLNDTFGRLLGRYWRFPDRGHALERAFERQWTAADGFALNPDQVAAGIVALQQQGPGPAGLPHVFLNGTDAKTGRRVITSTVKFDWRDDLFSASDDLLAILEHDVPASVAVTNSARFPYISPPGRYFDRCQGQRQVLDGGYFENYGARTASELAERIEALATRDDTLRNLEPVVVVVSSDADAYGTLDDAIKNGGLTIWRASIACRAPPSPEWEFADRSDAERRESWRERLLARIDESTLPEVSMAADYGVEGATPLLGLYAAHGAHGQDALHILRRQLCPARGDTGLARMAHIALPRPTGIDEAAPMNWVLNAAARRYLLGETGVFEIEFNTRQTNLLVNTLKTLRNGKADAPVDGAG